MNFKKNILDSLLVREAQRGNERALSILVSRWHSKLCFHANWYLNDADASKDIAQDTWRVAILKLNTLKDPNKFGGWLLTIARRKAIDELKKRSKKTQIQTNESHMETIATIKASKTNDAVDVLRLAIRSLSKEKQQILHLFYTENFNVRSISEILGIPVGTVKSRLFSARKELKITLKNKL